MNRRTLYIALPVLLLAAGLIGCTRDEAAGDYRADVWPDVWETLETEETVEVVIWLGNPPSPLPQWTDELRIQYATERKANVLAVLSEDEFTQTAEYSPIWAMLHGRLTASGLQKLAQHPDVVMIRPCCLGGNYADFPAASGTS